MSIIDKLTAEENKLKARSKKINEERERIQKRLFAIEAEKHRLTLAAAVGQQVRIRYRYPAGDRCAKLNDAVGTLEAVKRTRASVDFGEHGKWTFPIDYLILPDDKHGQGFMLGGASK